MLQNVPDTVSAGIVSSLPTPTNIIILETDYDWDNPLSLVDINSNYLGLSDTNSRIERRIDYRHDDTARAKSDQRSQLSVNQDVDFDLYSEYSNNHLEFHSKASIRR